MTSICPGKVTECPQPHVSSDIWSICAYSCVVASCFEGADLD